MQRKTKPTPVLLAIVVLFMQTLFGSLPAMAIDENNAISSIVTQMPTTSADSAAITQQTTTADSAVIYVKQGTSGNGTSWTNAFGDLQSALEEASTKLTAVEIWLAQGTYTPTKEVGATGARYATFQMQNNVAIYGGFNGTETTVTERDWKNHKTILSGDIDNTPTDNTGNAYHVFCHPDGLNLNATAILDGVTITGGNANSSVGGGMFNAKSSPTLTNVTFDSNTAFSGGGMYNNVSSSPTLTNVTFDSNTASSEGGGMFNKNSSPALTNVTFDSNTAHYGGGMYNDSSRPPLTNVTFDSNTARFGGSMYNYDSSPSLTNVTFDSNTASSHGGGMYNSVSSSPILTNVTMSGNKGTNAIYGGSANSKIQNSIIVGNDGNSVLTYYSGTIENSLLDVKEGGKVLAKFHQSIADIQPDTYTPEAIFIDPSQRNYQLRAGSPAINKGNDALNTQSTDLLGNPRRQGSFIDLGAYESEFAYHVMYERNGAIGDTPVDNMTYKQGGTVTVQNRGNLARTGFTFTGWNTQADGQGQDYAENASFTMRAHNQTFYAQWAANTYPVTFESNGGSTITAQQVPYNTQASEPTPPSKQGHTFVGWYKDAALTQAWHFTTDVVTEAITLYAKWTANPPATGGGSQPSPPPVSTDNDYSPPRKVTITLQTNGGTILKPIEITYNTKISHVPSPTRAGYRFDGWYQDEALTKPLTEETVVRESTLYAKWTALPVEEPQQPEEPQPSKPIVTFRDVERHWAKEMIEELTALGIIQGYEDGSFRPNAPISRMHVAVLLTRAFSLETVRTAEDFSDVPKNHPYYEAIAILQQAGIVDGSNGAFHPTENMTRAQLAKVLVGVLGLTPQGTSSFKDVDSQHWSAGYIAVLEREGIALGDNGNFRLNEPVTRAQFVAFLYRIMQMER
ncbi:InlB B-repeat-containing protein [Lysinibacillus macroides]|nr:InlB B-repeat-containing protein [Lysinibacillus macroides]QPR69777.1 InlB B-repeat-containing protein [Lysinibacillus macroides]